MSNPLNPNTPEILYKILSQNDFLDKIIISEVFEKKKITEKLFYFQNAIFRQIDIVTISYNRVELRHIFPSHFTRKTHII